MATRRLNSPKLMNAVYVEAWIKEGNDNFLPLGDSYVPPLSNASGAKCSVAKEVAACREEAFRVGLNAMAENLVRLLLAYE